jgi:hypothetical protein
MASSIPGSVSMRMSMARRDASPGAHHRATTAPAPGGRPPRSPSVHFVYWATIPDPDPTFPPGTTNNQAIRAVGDQGREKGAAIFSRLEGLHYGNGTFYIVSTQGGDAPGGPTSGFGSGFGQVWGYDPATETLTLVVRVAGEGGAGAPR